MRCHYCEQEKDGLPFRCNYCGESFCGEHRLPENHSCPKVGGPLQPGHSKPFLPALTSNRGRERQNFATMKTGRPRFRMRYAGIFSRTEKKHILVATIVMSLVGLSFGGGSLILGPLSPLSLIVVLPVFAFSFIGHELAHKFLSQRNGLWAEFRTTAYGLMITIISVALPIKFLAPGQTNIQGTARKEILGTIALIGPGFNLVLGMVFFLFSKFSGGQWGMVLMSIVGFNAWLALFNLIPFGSLDGTRVFEWDKTRWAISFAVSIFLIVVWYLPNLLVL